jgi:LysR family transcriptional regulator, glycine cleavage system transcriptional activator
LAVLTRPPSLRAVAAFEAAARYESFTKAAEELNLTHSAISHAIRSLEQRLGAQLFTRVGRRVSLTHEGANLVKRVRVSLTLLTDAMDRRPQLGRSRLSIGADAGVAVRLIAPRLCAFKTLHPEIDIDLRSVASTAALTGAEIDLAVRFGSAVDLGLSSRLIAHERLWPVAAPGVARSICLDDVSNSCLIESLEHPWSLWFSQGRRKQPIGAPALLVDSDLLALEVAKSGLGICLAPGVMAQKDLDDGLLVKLSDECVRARSFYHLDWYPLSSRAHEIELFIAWLRQAISAETPSFPFDEAPLSQPQVCAA